MTPRLAFRLLRLAYQRSDRVAIAVLETWLTKRMPQ